VPNDCRRSSRLSREVCEHELGRACTSLAYPYSDWSEHVAEAAGQAGYETAGTLSGRVATGAPLRTGRIGVYRSDTQRRFELKLAPAVQRLRRTPVWPLFQAAWLGLAATRMRVRRMWLAVGGGGIVAGGGVA
jgi:hypothetical protein